jgi:hypothetical protein
MVLLYVILSNMYPSEADSGICHVEKSLEIFASMRMLCVARRCYDMTKEVLDIANRLHLDRQERHRQLTNAGLPTSDGLLHQQSNAEAGIRERRDDNGVENILVDDLYAGLVDTNVAFSFLDFEDWSAWYEPTLG